MIERVCRQCGETFVAKEYQVKQGYANFCSVECFGKSISRKVEVKCQYCGKNFLTKPSVIKKGSGKFCSMKCYAQFKRSQENWNWWRKGKNLPEEVRQKIAQARLGSHASDETKKRMSISRKGKIPYNAIKAVTAKWQDPEWRQRVVEAALRGNSRKPNKPELKLQAILDKYFPNEWQYTGDGYHTIGGFAPDFTNCNGKKQLIELFGDYWHSPRANPDWHQTELGRIMAYNSLGYKCLILWEYELKTLGEEEITEKVETFFRRKNAQHHDDG